MPDHGTSPFDGLPPQWSAWFAWLSDRRTLKTVLPVVVLLVVGLILVRSTREPSAPLGSCTAREFAALRQKFAAEGLRDATYRDGMIYAPAENADAYRKVIQSNGDRSSRSSERRWADVWQSANDRLGQFSGSREREAAREIARAQTIGRLLSDLPDIAEADVVWDEAPAAGWQAPPQVRATVYLKAEEGRAIGPHVIDAVRRAVAGSKANLSPTNVVVMDQSSGRTYDGDTLDPREARLARMSAEYRRQIESSLSYLPGVRVDVSLVDDDRPDDNAAESTLVRVANHAGTGGSGTAETSPSHTDRYHQRLGDQLSVAIAIPEATIRALSGWNNPSNSGSANRRRDVFRSVEQHVHVQIRDRLTTLIPAVRTLDGRSRIHIETIPVAALSEPVIESDATTLQSFGTVLWEHRMLLIAVATGFAAFSMLVSMFRQPRRTVSSTSPSLTSDPSADLTADLSVASQGSHPRDNRNAVADRDIGNALTTTASVTTASATDSGSAGSTFETTHARVAAPAAKRSPSGGSAESADVRMADEREPSFPVHTDSVPPARDTARPDPSSPSTTVYSGRHVAAQRDVLNDVLTRLETPATHDDERPIGEAIAQDTVRTSGRTTTEDRLADLLRHEARRGSQSSWNDRDPDSSETCRSVSPSSSTAQNDITSRESTQPTSDEFPQRQSFASRITPRDADDPTEADTIESLRRADSQTLASVAKAIDIATWARALFGTSQRLQEQILPHLNAADADRLRAELKSPRPMRLREIDEAQADVLHCWREIDVARHESDEPRATSHSKSSFPASFAAVASKTPVAD